MILDTWLASVSRTNSIDGMGHAIVYILYILLTTVMYRLPSTRLLYTDIYARFDRFPRGLW